MKEKTQAEKEWEAIPEDEKQIMAEEALRDMYDDDAYTDYKLSQDED